MDQIEVQANAAGITTATVAGLVQIWEWDGTKAWLKDEIPVDVVVPSTTVAAFATSRSYSDWVLPAAHSLYASLTVANAVQVTAAAGVY